MHEGRPACVSLLDGECLEISVNARLSVNDVLTLAAHHCRITQPDAQYFGIAFIDDNEQYHWLQPDKKLLDYEFPSKKAVIQLSHSIRFFVDSIFSLENPAIIELFFLEAHQQLRKGQLDLSNVDYVRVGGLLLQIYRGDFIEQNSFENEVLKEYNRLRGVQRGTAIILLMKIVEKCSKYGSRLYRVNDKSGSTCILSINSRGIQVYENVETFRPKENFPWKFLDNLLYKDHLFSVEVREPRSTQILDTNVSDEHVSGDDDIAQAVSDPTTQ
ncbi:FERM protein [Dictyocaulus viviparus]|uniref:FERM protein n=1 Tax=Dictyocaulus viviparus TaxID=29172 RepID=A0A0D8Y1H9_DICVI|nr:FERM protein [Dictyocaulus viviparus]